MSAFQLVQAFDQRTFQSLFRSFASYVAFAKMISKTADGWFYFILIPLILAFKSSQAVQYILLALMGYGIERVVYFILKNTFKRRRPAQAIDGFNSIILASDEFSLPSGHTSAAFFFVTFLSFGLNLIFLPLYIWAVMVGASRVILGVHFVTDIVIGCIMGTTIAVLVL